jgi:hypothetical protein
MPDMNMHRCDNANRVHFVNNHLAGLMRLDSGLRDLVTFKNCRSGRLYSLVRTMGSAVGISIVTTIMSRQAQVLWNESGGNLNAYNSAVKSYLHGMHLDPQSPQAVALLAQQVGQQAADAGSAGRVPAHHLEFPADAAADFSSQVQEPGSKHADPSRSGIIALEFHFFILARPGINSSQ